MSFTNQCAALVREGRIGSMTLRQIALLGLVCRDGMVQTKDAAACLKVSKPVISRASVALAELSLLRLMRGRQVGKDGRAAFLEATPKGMAFFRDIETDGETK